MHFCARLISYVCRDVVLHAKQAAGSTLCAENLNSYRSQKEQHWRDILQNLLCRKSNRSWRGSTGNSVVKHVQMISERTWLGSQTHSCMCGWLISVMLKMGCFLRRMLTATSRPHTMRLLGRMRPALASLAWTPALVLETSTRWTSSNCPRQFAGFLHKLSGLQCGPHCAVQMFGNDLPCCHEWFPADWIGCLVKKHLSEDLQAQSFLRTELLG